MEDAKRPIMGALIGEDGTVVKLGGLQSIEESDLKPIDMNSDNWKRFRSTKSFSFECAIKPNARALYYFFRYGNDLYLRFPKKLRRKKGWIRWRGNKGLQED